MFLKQIEALNAIESLKTNYFSYASALKVLAELEPLVDAGLVPELVRARHGFPQGRSLESYNRSLMVAIGTARTETAGGRSGNLARFIRQERSAHNGAHQILRRH